MPKKKVPSMDAVYDAKEAAETIREHLDQPDMVYFIAIGYRGSTTWHFTVDCDYEALCAMRKSIDAHIEGLIKEGPDA